MRRLESPGQGGEARQLAEGRTICARHHKGERILAAAELLRHAHVNPVERMCDFKVDHPPAAPPNPPPTSPAVQVSRVQPAANTLLGKTCLAAQRNRLKLVLLKFPFFLLGLFCVDGVLTHLGPMEEFAYVDVLPLKLRPQLHIYTK